MKQKQVYFISMKDMLDGKLTVKKLDEHVARQARKKKLPAYMKQSVGFLNLMQSIEERR